MIPNSLGSKLPLVWQDKCDMIISSNLASFHLWWKENLIKHQKVSKYYENDCSLIDNLKELPRKRTVPHYNYAVTNSINLWGMPDSYSVELHWLQAGEPRRNWAAETYCFKPILPTLTSLQLVLFPSFIYNFFIHTCFGFDETKLRHGKLYRKLRPVLKYNFKERDWIFRPHRQMVMWNLQNKILYILSHTGNDKDRLQLTETPNLTRTYTISERFS